ncbi:MAG: hypothetical protein NTZ38_01790 [Candidatus Taylorbacteria bacterium]|nr:hypothetical protein [Candidatus Taylorbacteria bacterium]
MIKNFDTTDGVVIATVVKIPTSEFFFVKNGEPKEILCHCNQGGNLAVSDGGHLLFEQDRNRPVYPPSLEEEVVLIRQSNRPGDKEYTKAGMWVPESDWQRYGWAVNAHTTFRAFAHDHRNGDRVMSLAELKLTEGVLIDIVKQSPRQIDNDPLQSGFTSKLGTMSLSYQVRWERLEPDDTWTKCADPRAPVHTCF